MSSSSAIQLSAGCGRIAILSDKLRLILRFYARRSEIDEVRNPLIALAAIGSQEERSCSAEHAL